MTDSPSMQLAKRIMEKFIEEGVLAPTDAEKMLGKLATGKLKGEDWQVALDLTDRKGLRHE